MDYARLVPIVQVSPIRRRLGLAISALLAASLLTVSHPEPALSASAPEAPVIVQVDTTTSGEVTIDFTRPYDGGTAITDYEYSTDGGTTWSSFGSTAQSQTIGSLTDGTQYNIKVRAVNGAAGAASLRVQATPGLLGRAPFDISEAVRYQDTGVPIGSENGTTDRKSTFEETDTDDGSDTVPLPVTLNFFGRPSDGACLTTNGTLYLVATPITDCSDAYDDDLENLALSGEAPIIAALANDGDPSRNVSERVANVAFASYADPTLSFETTQTWDPAGGNFCVFLSADNIDNGKNEATEPVNQLEVCGTVAGAAGTSFSMTLPTIRSGYKNNVASLSDFAYLTNLMGFVFDPDSLLSDDDEDEGEMGVSDGFGYVADLYYGTVDLNSPPTAGDTTDDSFVFTAYRVAQYDNENSTFLTNTWQIVLTPDLDDGNASDGYGFDIEFNYGSIQDADDGYNVDSPSRGCSSGELVCRAGIGTADYLGPGEDEGANAYELFATTPWTSLTDWSSTAAMTRNSLNSDVLGRYAFEFSGTTGAPTNFAVPVMDGSGTTTPRPGEAEEAPTDSGSPPCVARCNDDDEVVAVSPQPSTAAPGTVTRSTPPQETVPRDEPVLRDGRTPRPSEVPQATLGGRSVPVVFEVSDDSRLEVSARAGLLSLGVQVQQDEGSVSQSDDGSTEITVRKGARTSLSGSGLRPESTVQVFLPLQGANAKELTRILVGPDGSFSGDAVFATQPDEDPLPVGRQVLQLVSVDENGDEFVVDMTVNIAQPPPAPELNRVEGVIPTLTPGSSIATNAGVPEQVRVSAVEEQKLAVVEGDGWSMAIGVAAEDGGVQATDGGASLTLVRNEPARVSGDGFMPGTRADVWLFSEPTLLGTVTIDDEGRFDGEVNIDGRVIAVGNHTLQLQGVGEDGYVRAANMGVTVGDPAEVVPTAEENSVMFIWWVLAALVLIALVIVFWIAVNRRRQA